MEPALVCYFRRKTLVVASTDKRVVALVNAPMDRGRDPEIHLVVDDQWRYFEEAKTKLCHHPVKNGRASTVASKR